MPETGFAGPLSALNQTTVSYPGSVRTRFGDWNPQTHTYASFAPVLHYNPLQGDLVGGAFWDMRATGLRLNSPLAEQAQGPPLDPAEMGMIDAACVVYRLSQRPYRQLAEQVWSAQTFAIHWPRDVKTLCDRPGPAPDSDPLPVHLSSIDHGIAQATSGPRVNHLSTPLFATVIGRPELSTWGKAISAPLCFYALGASGHSWVDT